MLYTVKYYTLSASLRALQVHFSNMLLLRHQNEPHKQGCGIGAEAGVRVARSRGNEQGAGVGVGFDQTALTPAPERLV